MWRITTTIIALGFVGILLFWIFAGYFAVYAVDQIGQQGIRGVAEQLWCGAADPNCLSK